MTDAPSLAGPRGAIVFATDGSRGARGAAAAAAHLSRVLGAKLHVVHCWMTPTSTLVGLTPPELDSGLEQTAREILEDEVMGLRVRGAPISGAELCHGRPVDCVPDLAERLDARLIVAGSRGLGAVKRFALGSISEGLVHASRVPVLIVHTRNSWPPRRILVGEDGSADSRDAAVVAAQIASATSNEMVLIHVQPFDWRDVSSWDAGEYRAAKRAAKARLKELAAELQDTYRVRVRARIEVGWPPAVLVRLATRSAPHSMIAVGSRGHGAMVRLALGSVSNRVLRDARGSVLICHTPTKPIAKPA